jgi:hypothetical protein
MAIAKREPEIVWEGPLAHGAGTLRSGSGALDPRAVTWASRTTEPGERTPPPRPSTPWPHSRREAEVERIVRALREYGVLTRARLLEFSGAAHWSDAGARRALADAVSSGRIRRLGDDLYEIATPRSDEADAA